MRPRRLAAAQAWVLLLATPYAVLVACNAEAATAVAAGLALIGAAWTLKHSETASRRSLTAEYRARWERPELIAARVAVADFIELENADEDSRWREWKETMDVEARLRLVAVLNFWEAVGTAYNHDLLDNDWFRDELAWEMQYSWERAGWFIRKFRVEDRNAAGYCEWQRAWEAVRGDLEQQSAEGSQRLEEALARDEDVLYVDQG